MLIAFYLLEKKRGEGKKRKRCFRRDYRKDRFSHNLEKRKQLTQNNTVSLLLLFIYLSICYCNVMCFVTIVGCRRKPRRLKFFLSQTSSQEVEKEIFIIL